MSTGWCDTTGDAMPSDGGLRFGVLFLLIPKWGVLPVVPSSVLLGPRLSYGVALGGPTGLPRARWVSVC